MSSLRVLGIDPGPVPGIVMLHYGYGGLVDTNAVQSTAPLLFEILPALLRNGRDEWPRTMLAVEKFVVRGRASSDQRLTSAQVPQIVATATNCGAGWIYQRPAAAVKPWATDERLEAAGLLESCKGMRHARDAARQALFCAVHDGGVPDPLSKDARR